MPKLPVPPLPVSYPRTLGFDSSTTSQTLTLPSKVLLAKNWPSSLSAMAHTSPVLAASPLSSRSRRHSPVSGATAHILTSPPKPALAATAPFRDVQRWWQPSLCASLMDCERGIAGSAVLCTRRVDEPLPERTAFLVTAREKMSVM